MRITTNGSLYTYKNNLRQTVNSLNSAMTKLMTHRNFDSYSFDPAVATRTFKIHSSLNAVNTQYMNNNMVLHKYETAWSSMDKMINDLAASMGQVPALQGLNGTNLSTLKTQGEILSNGADAMIQSLNNRYDDDFLFAGAGSQEVPFAINDQGFVTYRGVEIDNPATLGNEYKDANGQPMLDQNQNPMTNQEVLDKWSKEHQYVDIGLGFKMNGDEVIDSSAFDAAISGLEVMGYGRDNDGDPKNIVSIMKRLSDIFQGYDHDTGTWNVGSQEEAERLVGKFNKAQEALSQQHVQLDTDAKFLNTNQSQLKMTYDSLNTERHELEDAEPADAILELSWAQDCYMAALQAGSKVIPQSLMDYIN